MHNIGFLLYSSILESFTRRNLSLDTSCPKRPDSDFVILFTLLF